MNVSSNLDQKESKNNSFRFNIPQELVRYDIIESLLSKLHEKNLIEISQKIISLFNPDEYKLVIDILQHYFNNNQFYLKEYSLIFLDLIRNSFIQINKFTLEFIPLPIIYYLINEKLLPMQDLKGTKLYGINLSKIENFLQEFTSPLTNNFECIFHDDVEAFKSLYDQDKISNNFIYIPCFHETIPILDFSVLTKSEKCFEFLLSKGHEINEDTCDKILKYGTIKMIEKCTSPSLTNYISCNLKKSIL